jgi:hypothetical protein
MVIALTASTCSYESSRWRMELFEFEADHIEFEADHIEFEADHIEFEADHIAEWRQRITKDHGESGSN